MRFPPVVEYLQPAEQGVARIEHFEITSDTFQGFRGDYIRPGKYARLYAAGSMMMSDTPFEHRTNSEFARNANGDVLIAGLGLGMILQPLIDNPQIKSITVIEKYSDVIDLIAPHFSTVNCICADVHEWTPPKGQKWDTIYFDIWPDICTDNLEQITRLHRRFKSRLNRENANCWMGSWCHAELKYRRSKESRRGY